MIGPEVIASWNKPANVTQFKIEYSSDNGNSWTADEGLGTADGFVETTDGGSTTVSYTFSTLNGNTGYITAVTALVLLHHTHTVPQYKADTFNFSTKSCRTYQLHHCNLKFVIWIISASIDDIW